MIKPQPPKSPDATKSEASKTCDTSTELPGVIPNNFPAELTTLPQWVCWDLRIIDGDLKKVPINPKNRRPASVIDPATWTDFATALSEAPKSSGIGFVFTEDDEFVGCDLDKVLDPQTGELDPTAQEIVTLLDSYTELSQSGRGLHIITKGKLPDGRRRRVGVELYDSGRFFCMTGNLFPGSRRTIEPRQPEITALHDKVFETLATQEPARRQTSQFTTGSDKSDRDTALVRRIRKAVNGRKFSNLHDKGDCRGYGSHSEADQALLSILVFWCDDVEVIDRLFRKSKLYRLKWDEMHGELTYGQLSIQQAMLFITARRSVENANKAHGRNLNKHFTKALIIDSSNIFWKGSGGSTRKALLEAHHSLSQGKLYYGASVRALAEAAGISSLETVSKNNRLLCEQGWIIEIRKGSNKYASIYCLNIPPHVLFNLEQNEEEQSQSVHSIQSNTTCDLKECTDLPCLCSEANASLSESDGNALDDPSCDVWRWRGLGKSKYYLWRMLDPITGRTPKDLAKALGRHVNTVRAQVNRLAYYGLAHSNKGLWYRTYRDVMEVAGELRVAGTLERQQSRHIADRNSYDVYMEELLAHGIFKGPSLKKKTGRLTLMPDALTKKKS